MILWYWTTTRDEAEDMILNRRVLPGVDGKVRASNRRVAGESQGAHAVRIWVNDDRATVDGTDDGAVTYVMRAEDVLPLSMYERRDGRFIRVLVREEGGTR